MVMDSAEGKMTGPSHHTLGLREIFGGTDLKSVLFDTKSGPHKT